MLLRWLALWMHVMLNLRVLWPWLLVRSSIHHITRLHLMMMPVPHLPVHHGPHAGSLPHCCLQGTLWPSVVVHQLAVREGTHAWLAHMLRVIVHAHAEPMTHGHHHVISHGLEVMLQRHDRNVNILAK